MAYNVGTMFLTGLEELLAKVAAFSAPSVWDNRMAMRKQMTQAGKPKVQATAKKPPPSFAQPTKTYHIDPTSVYA